MPRAMVLFRKRVEGRHDESYGWCQGPTGRRRFTRLIYNNNNRYIPQSLSPVSCRQVQSTGEIIDFVNNVVLSNNPAVHTKPTIAIAQCKWDNCRHEHLPYPGCSV
jgi:hypothetical protein